MLHMHVLRLRCQHCVPTSRALPVCFCAPQHVVFGRVIDDGLLVMRKVENVATGKNNRPNLPCVITECGEM